jgi:superfamily I DNA/RNA helicase
MCSSAPVVGRQSSVPIRVYGVVPKIVVDTRADLARCAVHGIGARLLREYADQIGIDPAFTTHDREDSADLVNLVRHELGFSRTRRRGLNRHRSRPAMRANKQVESAA